MARRSVFLVGLFVIAQWAAHAAAQQLPPGTDGDTFEVASIKPAQRPQVPVPRIRPGVFEAGGVALSDLIRFAYPTANGQVFVDSKAPGWVTTDRFDVIAKSAGPQPSATMLRALLAERFKLRARLEPREGTVFELTLARADGRLGAALIASQCGSDNEPPPATADEALARAMSPKAPPTAPCQALRIGCCPSLIGEGVTIADLARTLTYAPIINAPVIDRTGLTGRYDFKMNYRGDNNPNPDAGPTLPDALHEQLGLKLQRTKGTIDVVVIDYVDRLQAN